MRFLAPRPHVPQHENFTYNDISHLSRTGSVIVRIAVSTAAVLLVIASAGFGCFFAYTQGHHQGVALAVLAVCMALGLEAAKPFAVEAAFASLRSLAVGRALAMALLAAVAIAYSLTAELSLMAMSRGDMAASRAKAMDTTQDERAELARIVAERAAMSFAPATAETVTAARDAVAAAERTRQAECGRRGPQCRARETNEATARQNLADAIAAKAATERAAALDTKAEAIRSRLAKAPATAAADPGAAALAGYLGTLGVKADAGVLAQWLVLVGVLALEVGSALAVVLATPLRGGAVRDEAFSLTVRPKAVEAVQQLPPVPQPANAAVAPAAAPQTASPKKGRGRPPRERQAAKAAILGQLKANGGKVAAGAVSVRRLGKMAGVSKSTVNSVLLGLMAAGIVAKAGGALVLGGGHV